MHFIIFSGSPGIGQGKLQCFLSGGKEPGRCEGSARQEGLVPPWQVKECLLRVPAGDIFPSLVCTWISCALPRFCRASADCLLVLPFCHLASLTQLSLAEVEILMFCLNLEVIFSSAFIIRTNELLQCNLFYFLLMEFDLNFSTDEDDVLTGWVARIISPVCSADVSCSCPESSPAIKTFLSIILIPLSAKSLSSLGTTFVWL